MKNQLTRILGLYGPARTIITGFLLLLCAAAFALDISVEGLISDFLVRVGMNAILVLAILVGIRGGIGLNFGIPVGIVGGLLGAIISMEFGLTGLAGLAGAILISVPIAVALGYIYGVLLNHIKGDEMTVATYIGFSVVSLFSIVWIMMPVKNPQVVWPIGKGVRLMVPLTEFYSKILDRFLALKFGGLVIPTGLLLFFAVCCFLVWIFFRTKTGIAMIASGSNEMFAKAAGLNVNNYRLLSTIISTVLAAIGIIVYSQSYGFYQMYQSPLMMGFVSVAAILIGGASPAKASIAHVVIGLIFFQGILTISMPVANQIVEGNIADIVRVLVSNGIILYALTKAGDQE